MYKSFVAAIAASMLPTAYAEILVVSAEQLNSSEFDIYLVDDAGDTTNLTNTLGGDSYEPRISPDGEHIAFVNVDTTGFRQLWVMDIDGDNKEQLTDVQHQYGPICWPWLDNNRVMYRYAPGPSTGDIRSHDITTGIDELVLASDSIGEGSIDDVEVSPDRSELIIAAQAGSWSPTTDLYLYDLQSTHYEKITHDDPDDTIDRRPRYIGAGFFTWEKSTSPGVGESNRELRMARTSNPAISTVEVPSSELASKQSLARSPSGDQLLLRDTTGMLLLYSFASQEFSVLTDDLFSSIQGADWSSAASPDTACSAADLDDDGDVDFFDVSAFIQLYNIGCP